MKTIKKASIVLCLFLTIAILTAGTVSASLARITPEYQILALQHTDKYTYDFQIMSLDDLDTKSNFYWNFGDGTESSYSLPTHTYTSSGQKTVIAYFATSSGQQKIYTRVYPGVQQNLYPSV